MFAYCSRIDRRIPADDADDTGFTLIELLIVIVVMGVLAAVVIFALGGVSAKSQVSACNTDAKTVQLALTVYETQNPTATSTESLTALQSGGYLASAPASGNGYTISVSGSPPSEVVQVAIGTGTAATYTGSAHVWVHSFHKSIGLVEAVKRPAVASRISISWFQESRIQCKK